VLLLADRQGHVGVLRDVHYNSEALMMSSMTLRWFRMRVTTPRFLRMCVMTLRNFRMCLLLVDWQASVNVLRDVRYNSEILNNV